MLLFIPLSPDDRARILNSHSTPSAASVAFLLPSHRRGAASVAKSAFARVRRASGEQHSSRTTCFPGPKTTRRGRVATARRRVPTSPRRAPTCATHFSRDAAFGRRRKPPEPGEKKSSKDPTARRYVPERFSFSSDAFECFNFCFPDFPRLRPRWSRHAAECRSRPGSSRTSPTPPHTHTRPPRPTRETN